jgi:hypothetical protein
MSFVRPNRFVFVQWVQSIDPNEFKEAVEKYGKDRGMNPQEVKYFAKHFLTKTFDETEKNSLIEFLDKWDSTFATETSLLEFKSFSLYRNEALLESLVVAEDDEERIAAMSEIFSQEIEKNPEIIDNLDEGFLGSLVGGVAGFFVGPMIGKVIANALGVEKGILYDMFTSKLVGAALGMAVSKHLGK